MKTEDNPVLAEPQLTPSEHCYLILQDHGPENGGWGPSTILLKDQGIQGPAVYTGNNEETIKTFTALAEQIAHLTGKPTKFVRFSEREDIASFNEENS